MFRATFSATLSFGRPLQQQQQLQQHSSRRLLYVLSNNNTPSSSSLSSSFSRAVLPVWSGRRMQQQRNVNLFAEFAKSIKRQIDENREFQQNVKLLNAETNKLADSEAVQRAKKAMEKGAESTSKVMDTVKVAAEKVADTMEKTMEQPVIKKTVETVVHVSEKVGETVHKVADPILETEAAKKVASGIKTMKKDIVDTTTTHRYIEYRPKEERERKYAELKAEAAQLPHGSHRFRQVAADLEAGSAVITHQESKMTQKWKEFKETNSVFQGLLRARRSVEESENPMIERVRDFFSSAMQETEEAQVIRYIHSVDPTFTIDKFMCDATEFYIPEIMEAYLRGDEPILKEWCSEPLYAQLIAGVKSQKSQGLISDSRILDIRKVELTASKILENDLPILLLDFNTQEVLIFKNRKGEIVLGSEDHIEHARYRIVFTKDQCSDPTLPINPKTNGWRAIEAIKVDSWASW